MILGKNKKYYWINLLGIINVLLINISCEEEMVLLVDENQLLGRWEVLSKSFFNYREEFSTDEDICEWTDSYTFKDENILIFQDSVRDSSDSCGDSPEFKLEGTWIQDNQGVLIFTLIRNIDESEFNVYTRNVYFQDDVYLVIEFDDSSKEFKYSKIILGKI